MILTAPHDLKLRFLWICTFLKIGLTLGAMGCSHNVCGRNQGSAAKGIHLALAYKSHLPRDGKRCGFLSTYNPARNRFTTFIGRGRSRGRRGFCSGCRRASRWVTRVIARKVTRGVAATIDIIISIKNDLSPIRQGWQGSLKKLFIVICNKGWRQK